MPRWEEAGYGLPAGPHQSEWHVGVTDTSDVVDAAVR